MTITAITIENFKGIREPIRIEFKPITLLFGPNSAGKSSIVQALHYAREIFERQNLNSDRTLLGGNTIDLGGFESMVNDHDKSRAIRLSFDIDLQKEDLPAYQDGIEFYGTDYLDISGSDHLAEAVIRMKNAVVQVEVKWSERFEIPYIATYTITANGSMLASIHCSEDANQVYLSDLNVLNPIFFEEGVVVKSELKKLIQILENKEPESEEALNLGCMWEAISGCMKIELNVLVLDQPINLYGQSSALPNWGKNLAIDDEIWVDEIDSFDKLNFIRRFSSLVTGPGELIRDELVNLCYIGPIRELPKRGHRPLSSPVEGRWANGLAAYDRLFFSDETFIARVNDWLGGKNQLASGYSVELKKYRELENDHPLMLAILQDRILDEDMAVRDQILSLPIMKRLLIRDTVRDIELAPQDIGVGISQVLPVVVAALHRKTGTLAIEQPELHIHPAFQVALGDLFIEQIRQRPDITFILETHSEHLMLRFLRRIRETGENGAPMNLDLVPEELSIYFIETGEDGISCTSIRIDKDGDFIDHWPQGFFDERAGELF